jgi:hypothetical protein
LACSCADSWSLASTKTSKSRPIPLQTSKSCVVRLMFKRAGAGLKSAGSGFCGPGLAWGAGLGSGLRA